MQKSAKIYIAGHAGLVGSGLVHALRDSEYENLLLRDKETLDLRQQQPVHNFFELERPDYVFLAAAKVGGIFANSNFPADFIADNLAIQSNIIGAAYKVGVKRLLFLGSSCIYPKYSPQPIPEESLLSGELELTNRPYAVAKIAGIEMCWAFNRQYGTHYLAAMPTNLYGPGDHYDVRLSHVIPALIRNIDDAKDAGQPEVIVWGTGLARREFLHSADLADACLFLMNLDDHSFGELTASRERPPLINIGSGEEMTIAELAEIIVDIVGYTGKLVFDAAKPDGTPRKLLDSTRLTSLGWRPRINFREGIRGVYESYLAAVKPQLLAQTSSREPGLV